MAHLVVGVTIVDFSGLSCVNRQLSLFRNYDSRKACWSVGSCSTMADVKAANVVVYLNFISLVFSGRGPQFGRDFCSLS